MTVKLGESSTVIRRRKNYRCEPIGSPILKVDLGNAKTVPIKPAKSSNDTVKTAGSLLPTISSKTFAVESLRRRNARYDTRQESNSNAAVAAKMP